MEGRVLRPRAARLGFDPDTGAGSPSLLLGHASAPGPDREFKASPAEGRSDNTSVVMHILG